MWLGDPIEIEVSRSADILIGIQFFDEETDKPLDLTDFTFSAKVAVKDGEAAFYAPNLDVSDYKIGAINIKFEGNQFDSIDGKKETVILSYQVIASNGDVDVIAMRGPLKLTPGI